MNPTFVRNERMLNSTGTVVKVNWYRKLPYINRPQPFTNALIIVNVSPPKYKPIQILFKPFKVLTLQNTWMFA